MKILLASGASYAPPKGGSTRSNLVWLRALAAGGHACRVVCAADSEPGETDQNGIAILRIADFTLYADKLSAEIHTFKPDWVLVSSEDVSQRLLRAADRAAFGRLVYLAHTPQFFPFGPESWNPDPEAARIVQRAVGVVAIGSHMAGYIERHCGVKAAVIHPPVYGEPPFTWLEQIERGMILMVNPCAVKGISIFLALAERFPQFEFGALAGWGTTSADRAAMAKLANVRVLESVPDIEQVLSHTRVLLMPSLWYEGFGLIAMEAMLRGIPVIASDSGGLLEAKAGTGYVVPVNPIERYQPVFDENHMPCPALPAQNIAAWVSALSTLLSNPAAYQEEAARSREAASRFVSGLRADSFAEFLTSLKPRITETQRALLLNALLLKKLQR